MSDLNEGGSPIKVLCVDDSASIIALLKAILTPKHGFTVIGAAENGRIAASMVADLKPDVMTLDIHMPELDGVSYMETQFKKGSHPPVVMISSVAREEMELAQRALKAGASDYVEKPTFNNLTQHAEEIRSKLQMAYKTSKREAQVSDFDNGVNQKKTDQKLVRLLIAGDQDVGRLPLIFSQVQGIQPPTIVLLDLEVNTPENVAQSIQTTPFKSLGVVTTPIQVKENEVGIMGFTSGQVACQQQLQGRPVCVCVLGLPSLVVMASLAKWSGITLILEDIDARGNSAFLALKKVATDVMPIHSMGYMAIKLSA